MIMTAADAGNKELTVVGPPDTNAYMASLRGSVGRDAFAVMSKAFPRDSTAPSELVYEHPRLSVSAVALRPEDSNKDLTSVLGKRPTALAQPEADAYAAAVVHDMFGRTSSITRPEIDAPDFFDGMYRYSSADDRYPLPLPSDADVATDMVYVCRAPDVRGKFNNELAKKLHIPNGPIRGKLTAGETIEFDDPTVPGGRRRVAPEECLVGGGQGAILAVVHCREHNLDRLLASAAFDTYRGHNPELKVQSAVHRVPRAVWEDERYQAWVTSFGPGTEHLYADSIPTHETFFAGAAWNALRLNMIDPDIFPVPYSVVDTPSPPTLQENATVLQVNQLMTMYPPKPTSILPNHPKDISFPTTAEALAAAREQMASSKELEEFNAAVRAAQASVAAAEAKRTTAPAPGDDIVVTTLGTGSAIPSKYRNVSSTYLEIPNLGSVLLDCGEGTLGQMRRRFGPEGMRKVYTDLKLINVSHMHADHHLGLCSILADRFQQGFTTPLYVIAPWAIALQLEETATWQAGVSREALENIKWINANRLKYPWYPRSSPDAPAPPEDVFTSEDAKTNTGAFCELTTAEDVAAGKRKWPFKNMFRVSPGANNRFHTNLFAMMADLGLSGVHAPLVSHRGVAYGLVLSHRSGWKVAYSGDTKPCDAFVEAARDATLLIHEATIEDDKPDVAEKKGHSTFGQAIDVGTRMNAKYIVLNHFSQRYPKAPSLQLSESGPAVAISFDFMSLRAADVWKMAHYMDAITILFQEVEDEDVDEESAPASKKEDKHTHRVKGPKDKQKHHEKAQAKHARKVHKAERREAWAKEGNGTGTDIPVVHIIPAHADAPAPASAGTKRESSASDDDSPAMKKRAVEAVQDKVQEMVVEEQSEEKKEKEKTLAGWKVAGD
jgi:ribonuclease Z